MSIGCARVSAQDQSLSLQLDALCVQWDPPRLYEIETDKGFSLEDGRQERGRSKLTALGWAKHGDVPRGTYD